jgi:hypothetical protein
MVSILFTHLAPAHVCVATVVDLDDAEVSMIHFHDVLAGFGLLASPLHFLHCLLYFFRANIFASTETGG